MMLDTTNPLFDAIETIRGTDVISDEKKAVLVRGIERLRVTQCPTGQPCASCPIRTRCVAAITDLLGS
ncbi:hypothetical protein [Azospirillum doebereinerae]|uniref:Uncharacterized protein n=1 Tax=Azospirillum doebereinerae TaxID=92933 RepID=A0A433J536_9PROT|nr:hypothetical protein [Azospirillum doebereinerae]MCG5243335.1 hypothetical protein [Azospirillum doebereinerae]RUQ67568.1 hypothetical protein EJ913_20315 [Azospirillum doebereinerae]